jgi:hypothetical protein
LLGVASGSSSRGPFRVGRALVMRISNPAVASMMFKIVFRGQAADWL